MGELDEAKQINKKVTEVTTSPMIFALEESKENITITTHSPSRLSKEEIIDEAFKFHSQGDFKEASNYYQYFIDQGYKDHRVFSNLGSIFKEFGKLKEAEILTRKAIETQHNYAIAHSNLGSILKELGKLEEAEISTRKAIELKHNYALAHFNLGSILSNLGKLEEAEISTRKAIKLSPNFTEAYCNLGGILSDLDKLKEAELVTRKAIELNPNYANAYSNLGSILRDLGELQKAELSTRKAIELNPNYAIAHSSLGSILSNLGHLQEAKLSQLRAIELDPNNAKAYYSLSLLKYSDENKIWKDQLFSENILKNKLPKDKIDIYFARANILHKQENYEESAKYLKLANKLKLNIYPSYPNILVNKSKLLLIESDKKEFIKKENAKYPESIFIVGMPRSGSTLVESILSMNTDVDSLGEINILEESFQERQKENNDCSLANLYLKKTNSRESKANITTNKWLYNYQYTGIICSQIPNAKIIHCYRNPLDNILSIYRTHFSTANQYASSLVDCSKIYLDQENIMTEYKTRFRSSIYDLNYDQLVNEPNQEINSLISWLGWEWNHLYLRPHINTRSVSTASSVQVRYPINSKSIGGWNNYKEMLKPAIEILTQTKKYKNMIS